MKLENEVFRLVEKDKMWKEVINHLEAENSKLKQENRRLKDIVKNLTDCL